MPPHEHEWVIDADASAAKLKAATEAPRPSGEPLPSSAHVARCRHCGAREPVEYIIRVTDHPSKE